MTTTDTDLRWMTGDCHHLAAAIHQMTYWDLARVDGAGEHVYVMTPDGHALDVHGPRPVTDIEAQYHTTAEPIGTPNDAYNLGYGDIWHIDQSTWDRAYSLLAAAGLADDMAREVYADRRDDYS